MSRARLAHAGNRATRRFGAAVQKPSFWRRFLRLNVGLMAMGLGLAVMLEANVGLGPWAVFHEGVAEVTGISFGRALQIVGVVVLSLSWWWTGERPGPGTFLNMLVVGPWVDLFVAQPWLPTAGSYAWGVPQFVVGASLVGLASGLYITASLGAGPRDGFVLGLSRLLGGSVRRTRGVLEFTVLAVGFLLGGSVGLGTLLFAALIGPVMQASIRLFEPRRPAPAAVAARHG